MQGTKKRYEQDLKLSELGKQSGINCASAAYLTYKIDASYANYGSVIAEFHNCGAFVGQKNYSKEFARLFLPHVYIVLRKNIASYICNEGLPIGIVADKMTVNHRTRHIVGIRIPIYDINHTSLFTSIYLEHHFCTDVTGKGLCESILNTIDKFGLSKSYLRNHLIGLAVGWPIHSIRCWTAFQKKPWTGGYPCILGPHAQAGTSPDSCDLSASGTSGCGISK